MGMTKSKIAVMDYTDFRKYLLDFYDEQKKLNPAFSYRYFAQKAGYNSSGLYKDLVNGRRNLNRSQILLFSKAMGHDMREAEYFENMVYFTQAKSVDERKRYFERMLNFRKSKAALIEADRYKFFSEWYYSAVRELLAVKKFKDDYNAIARSLNPTITPQQAKRAIRILTKLGFIKKDSNGHYRPVDSVMTTGTEIKSFHVANFQKSTMKLALEAIDRSPAKHRDISTLTLSISEDVFNVMKNEITAFRKKLLEMADTDKDLDRVYQFNLQFFPLSQIEEK